MYTNVRVLRLVLGDFNFYIPSYSYLRHRSARGLGPLACQDRVKFPFRQTCLMNFLSNDSRHKSAPHGEGVLADTIFVPAQQP